MRLSPEQLSDHLRKKGLAPLYYVMGDEELQSLESLDLIRDYARKQGVGERTLFIVEKNSAAEAEDEAAESGGGFDWNKLRQAAASRSLFSQRQLIEARMRHAAPGANGAAALIEYANHHAAENILLLSSPKIDQRSRTSKWYQALERVGVVIEAKPIKAPQLPAWITRRFAGNNKTIDPDAAALLAQRVEGNLLAAKQEIDKLCLLIDAPRITLQDAMRTVTDSARFDVFDLIESACAGDLERARRMLLGLRNEGVEAIAVFGALMWECRRIQRFCHGVWGGAATESLLREHRIWGARQAVYKRLLRRWNVGEAARLLLHAGRVDRVIKGAATADRWQELETFLFRLGGVRLA